MQNYQNTDVYPHRWDLLVDLSTGRTLSLDAGAETTEGLLMWVPQMEEVDDGDGGAHSEPDPDLPMVQGPLPADFEDQWLKPVAAAPKVAAKNTPSGPSPDTKPDAPAEGETPKP